MQRFMMFEDVPETSKIMYPDGSTKTKEEVKKDYPILATPLGVIGFTADDSGTVGDPILMGYYDDVVSMCDSFISQGCDLSEAKTNAEKCAVITDFVNNPVSEEDAALEAYLAL